MQKTEFTKFPKVPSVKQYQLPAGRLVVQEKLDGANAGIELMPDGDALIVHSRTRALVRIDAEGSVGNLVDDIGSFGGLIELVSKSAAEVLDFMNRFEVAHIYGEWLIPHTLQYPEEMWRHFYVFDLTERGTGYYFNPERLAEHLPSSFRLVQSQPINPAGVGAAQGLVDKVVAEWLKERRVEGAVIKSYELDAVGKLDKWGQRYAYKHVLPEFKEQHRRNPMFPVAATALTIEQRLAAELPERSIEKVYQKVCDARGGWENRHFPMFMGMVWQEYMEEHAVKAFQQHALPIVSIRALKSEVERRAREYALSRPVLPVA